MDIEFTETQEKAIHDYSMFLLKWEQQQKDFFKNHQLIKEKADKELVKLGLIPHHLAKALTELKIERRLAKRKIKSSANISAGLRGKKYIHFSNLKQIYIKKNELQEYLFQGWEMGKIRKADKK